MGDILYKVVSERFLVSWLDGMVTGSRLVFVGEQGRAGGFLWGLDGPLCKNVMSTSHCLHFSSEAGGEFSTEASQRNNGEFRLHQNIKIESFRSDSESQFPDIGKVRRC